MGRRRATLLRLLERIFGCESRTQTPRHCSSSLETGNNMICGYLVICNVTDTVGLLYGTFLSQIFCLNITEWDPHALTFIIKLGITMSNEHHCNDLLIHS